MARRVTRRLAPTQPEPVLTGEAASGRLGRRGALPEDWPPVHAGRARCSRNGALAGSVLLQSPSMPVRRALKGVRGGITSTPRPLPSVSVLRAAQGLLAVLSWRASKGCRPWEVWRRNRGRPRRHSAAARDRPGRTGVASECGRRPLPSIEGTAPLPRRPSGRSTRGCKPRKLPNRRPNSINERLETARATIHCPQGRWIAAPRSIAEK